VKRRPTPRVSVPTIVVTTSITHAPVTVEYSIPRGPKKKVKRIATPTLFDFGLVTTVVEVLLMSLILGILKNPSTVCEYKVLCFAMVRLI
jgi:hypothetical protein